MLSQSVPFIDLTRSAIRQPQFYEDVKKIVHNCSFSGAPIIEEFECEIAHKLSVNYAIGCANGTDALQIALRALNIGAADKVIIPNLTFWATCEAVVNVGAEPVIVDIELETFALDPNLLEVAIRESNIKAVILVNLYGGASKYIAEISRICRDNGIYLIQDNAQAYGVKYKGESIFKEFSDISTISFYPAKVLGAAGDAGALFTNSGKLAGMARKIANHGRKNHYSYEFFGYNSRIDAIQALYLVYKLRLIDTEIGLRVSAEFLYKDKIKNNIVKIFSFPEDVKVNGYLNIALLDSKEARVLMEEYLRNQKIGYGRVYPETISHQEICKDFKKILNGNAQKISDTILNLPLFAGMSNDEILHVVDSVNDFQL
jgi:dTDP-4-amino-4,6-dideoxygalactose transaminase